MGHAPKVEGSLAEVAERVADSHAKGIAFPKMEFADKAPVGDIPQAAEVKRPQF